MTYVNRAEQAHTDALPRHSEKTFHIAPEDIGISPATTGFQSLHFIDYDPQRTQGVETTPEYGGANGASVDPSDPDFGDVDVSANLTTKLCLNEAYFMLALMMGAPVSTDEGGGIFKHVFTSGKSVIPLGTMRDRDGQNTRLVSGVAVSSLGLQIARAGGTQTMPFTLLPRGYDISAGADLAPADEVAEVARLFVPAKQWVVKYGGTAVGRLLDGSLNYSTDLQPERYLDGTDRISASYVGDPSLTVGFGVRHVTEAQRAALGGAGNAAGVEFVGTGPSGTSISFEMPRVMGPVVFPSKDDKLQKLSFEGQASKPIAGDSMLTVTVLNTINPGS